MRLTWVVLLTSFLGCSGSDKGADSGTSDTGAASSPEDSGTDPTDTDEPEDTGEDNTESPATGFGPGLSTITITQESMARR